MSSEDSTTSEGASPKTAISSYALRLNEGSEFAEFEPSLSRLTVFHVLGVSRQVSLGYAEASLLQYFAEHPGEALSRQQLLEHAWVDRVVTQGSLNQAISALRSLMGDDQKREIILTVPRRGYQLNAGALMNWDDWQVRKAGIQNTAPVSLPAPANPSQGAQFAADSRRWHMPALWACAAGLSLSLLAGAVTHYFYSLFPPYVTEELTGPSASTHLTLLTKDLAELDQTRPLILSTLNRLDALGGGRVLLSRTGSYLEFNCFRADGTLRTLQVRLTAVQAVEDSYFKECLK